MMWPRMNYLMLLGPFFNGVYVSDRRRIQIFGGSYKYLDNKASVIQQSALDFGRNAPPFKLLHNDYSSLLATGLCRLSNR